MVRIPLVLLILLTPVPVTNASCGPENARPTLPATEVRDSAGIVIVENARPPEGSRLWRVGSEPAVSIGVREGEDPYLLYGVRDASRLPDGRIVVANGGSSELRVFGPLGTHLATWGGRGEGPGELGSLVAVEPWPGDSIAAWYGPRRGISLFDSHGNFGRNFTLERDDSDPRAVFVRPASVTRDGIVLAGHDPHMFVDDVGVEIRDAEGRLVSSLGTHPGDDNVLVDGWLDRRLLGGTAQQAVWGDLVILSPAGRYEIKAFSRDGTLAKVVRRDHESRAPTQADVDAFIEEQVYYPPGMVTPEIEEEQEAERRRYRAVPVAERIPGFNSIVVDRLDYLWVQDFEVPGERRPGVLWTVFDPEGRVLGYVETPEGLEIHEIGEDYILGQTYDALNVEYVQVWSLERRQ